ncbi:hypothetical protein [Kamptonema formosum]|uniref:hypothetical protein n=1 Tax=Kamptonema formosum TaxID=331992 RepID=UPI0003480596|nr:hypothetical protein [Oscillatoria sp. PCC 10802]
MYTNLLKLIGTSHIWVLASEVADMVKVQTEEIVSMEFWDVGVWVQIRHKKAQVVSYRDLPCWIRAIGYGISTCTHLDHLQELEYALRLEFQKRAKTYCHATQKELLRRIRERRYQLEAATYDRWQMELIAGSHCSMFRCCRRQAELDWSKAELWARYYWHFQPFPDLIDLIEHTWKLQKAHLKSIGAG